MSLLRIYKDNDAHDYEEYSSFDDIKDRLKDIGVKFERWQAGKEISNDMPPEEILEAYREEIDRLKAERGFLTEDVIAVHPQVENHPELRKKFLDEHTHSDDEARFFIDGKGLFCIHTGGHVYSVVCEKNDLINVPAGTPHWFDMGPEPEFKCIRVFTNKEGWVADFTGDRIASEFPRFEGEWVSALS